MNYHKISNLFEMLEGHEFLALVDDIRQHGQQQPIIVYEGQILDGRNRYKACIAAGVEPVFKDFNGTDPLAFVWSLNFCHRHLTTSQRAMIAVRLANMGHGGARAAEQRLKLVLETESAAQDTGTVTIKEAAAKTNVSRGSVIKAAKIQRDADPVISQAVAAGDLNLSQAETLSTLPAEEQRKAVDQSPADIKQTVSQVRQTTKRAAHIIDHAKFALVAQNMLQIGESPDSIVSQFTPSEALLLDSMATWCERLGESCRKSLRATQQVSAANQGCSADDYARMRG